MAKNGEYFLGFDLGGTKMLATIFDADLNVIASEKKKTRMETGQDEGMKRVAACIDDVLAKAKIGKGQLRGIGFGLPGVLDIPGGRIVRLLNVGWQDVPMRDIFQEAYGAPVVIDNDVNTGTYGEYRRGAGQGHQDIIGIFPGTGIGGGILINGRLHHGVTGGAGEIGHLLYDPSGPRCGCGNRGCYETYASRIAIAGRAAEAVFRGKAPYLQQNGGTDLTNIRSKALARAIEAGDTAIEEIVREAAFIVGLLACDMINTLSPGQVILGGGLVEAMEAIYLEECRRAIAMHAVPELGAAVQVAAATLGDNAVVLGAAALAIDAQ